LGPLQLQDAEN
jgi:hypothetical protein